jgi:hypothetical protein
LGVADGEEELDRARVKGNGRNLGRDEAACRLAGVSLMRSVVAWRAGMIMSSLNARRVAMVLAMMLGHRDRRYAAGSRGS